jgi:long-chain acyl-CoA synthetase
MGFSNEDLDKIMEQNRQQMNAIMPAYCKLAAIEIQEEEFAKTPKKSIKRYLYK